MVDCCGYGDSELIVVILECVSYVYDDYWVIRDVVDIVVFVKVLSDEFVYILGLSFGLIVVMYVLKNYLEVVKKIVFYELLINIFLLDLEMW